MNEYSEKDFGKILKKNCQALRHDLLALETDCFRIYDRNLQDFPLTVDLYGKYARVVEYSEEPMSSKDKETATDIINRMAYIESENIIWSVRTKREGREQLEKTELEPVIATVSENGLKFKVDLTSYADTGLFLDQMVNRTMIKEQSAGRDVLNLFSYTGSFSVYAASGRAKTVTSVDLSATYTKWAEENLAANGFSGDNYKCVCSDAMAFIDGETENHRKYDIVIFDPPSFSNSHKMDYDFDVQRDFVEWIKKICRLLRAEGFILFSTNLGSFRMDKRRLRGLGVKEISNQVRAPGFVKDRKGTVRSWIMSVEDSKLTLDWSEDKKPSKEYKQRRESRNNRNTSRNNSRDRFKDGHSSRRFDDSKEEYPRRRFDDRKDDRPRRRFDDRREEYPRRRFEDSREDYPRRRFDDRREDYPRRRFDEDRPRRRFDDSREDYPRKRFDDRRDNQTRRRFDNNKDEHSRSFEKSEYKSTERRSSRREKPYGFDSFRPARSRNDSADFFWNDEEEK